MVQQHLYGQGLIIFEAFRSHSDTPHSVGIPGRVIGPLQGPHSDKMQHSHETDNHATAGFETAIPIRGRPQYQALDRVASGIGRS